ncbi:efflux RND transporter periplasmic adaptor subunit [Moritella viscosa]|uniref:RND multidrug efflux membrane fusion protein MexE n=1 Tax=Moritella viscosa TaxID=80854 RepID=A0A1L0ALE1_9GAMM|nr:efflux RND transporter periplasmic adaptor subunit [Moritella viscosa]SGY88255.1 RND multidrug efflux membrane fusion protein MexE [Moritella viscosa]SGY90246.1 RND multidrug efflux membrane fusion protein MexE [Moritella viscosa]SHO01082.1 RND multidrug efflux membrane fusion protein MexE [Moritella viscosa]SHO01384.1 RND multidrug efflux membrane fusion protein MexE [Moritella viscosa]SHO02969.1 RND multidrug efflux membrane fusion protein MexE [Moritella viscosa]
MRTSNIFRTFMLTSLTALVLTACGSEESPQSQAQSRPAPKVSVAKVLNEPVTEWDEFTGRLEAPEQVTLVPRVSGYINSVNFDEGALVKKGAILFQIDPSVFMAEVQRLKAKLSSVTVAEKLAKNDYQRAFKLYKKNAVSEELIDTRQANMHQTTAEVASVKAALMSAELDLAYTRVKAPISGRVSYASVTMGNYVTAGQTELTSLVSTAHMYAYFDVDEQTYLKYAQLTAQHKRNDQRSDGNPVFMALANESDFPHTGVIDFVDNAINHNTGTIRVRARFANNSNDLLPGLFTRLRIAGSATYTGILIDDKAIGTDLNNKFVLVVDADNKLQYRGVSLGEKVQGLRIIKQGLSAEDKIVVNGLQKVRPNMVVEPNMVEMATPDNLSALRHEQAVLEQARELVLTRVAG